MAKVSPIKNSFNSGEFSPRLEGRTDLKKYDSAIREGLNMVTSVQGDIKNRSGSVFVAESKDSTKKHRLIEFEFSTEQAYVLEMGNLYFRVYRDNGRVEAGAFSAVFTAAFAASSPIDVTTTYLEADLFQLKYAQSADVLYITHPSYPARKISRTSDISWSIDDVDFQDGPYLATNVSGTNVNPSGTTGTINLTASGVIGINDDTGFQTTDIGRLFRFKDSAGNWTWLEITAWTSTTIVTALVKGADLATSTTSNDWRMGVWSATTGYPAAVTFYEDRLWFGGGTNFSQRVVSSRTGDYENFSPTDLDGTVLDDNGITITLNANNVNSIQWLQDDEKGLLCGTVGGEWIIRASSLQEAVSPTNVQAKRSSTYGSDNLMPIRAGKAVLFVQRSGLKLREMAYLFEADGFEAPDMTVFWDHITEGGIKDMAYQREPQSVIWAVRGDGTLISFIYERTQQVLGWLPHTIGGTDVVVESVASIPSPTGSRTEVWLSVKRTINGATKRYIEYFSKEFELTDLQEDAFFVDSGLTYDGTPATTLMGLFHLEGETVSLLADGATHPDVVVTGGAVTLTRSASKVQIGLNYISKMRLLRFDDGAQDGTSQGKQQRIHGVTFRVLRTLGGKVGPNFDQLDIIPYRDSSDPMNAAPPLFTGDIEVDWDGDYSSNETICTQQDQPLPFWVLAIMPQMRTYDR